MIIVARRFEFNNDVEISIKLSPDNEFLPAAIQEVRLVE